MTPPERYSISPLPSFCTCARAPSFAELLVDLWRWLRRDKPTAGERRLEQQVIDRLAVKLAEEERLSAPEATPAPVRPSRGADRGRRART